MSAVLLASKFNNLYEGVGRNWDWDAVMVQERSFGFPHWWSLGRAERASLLANSVELLKKSGFITYFLQLSKSKSEEQELARAQKNFIESKRMSENDVKFSVPLKVTLS